MLFSVQNSPLYQHLIESGVENISSEKTVLSEKDNVQKRTIHISQQDLVSGISFFTHICFFCSLHGNLSTQNFCIF